MTGNMSAQQSNIQILSFDDFGALEGHLKGIRVKYSDMIKKYEETLGSILRDARPTTNKSVKVQERWKREMQLSLVAANKDKGKLMNKKDDEKHKNKDKDKENPNGSSTGEWIQLDPVSVFVGHKNRGMAELYFQTINLLRENLGRINLAINVISKLKAKANAAGNTALVVAFVNDIPSRILLKPLDENASKFSMTYSLIVPAARPTAKSFILW